MMTSEPATPAPAASATWRMRRRDWAVVAVLVALLAALLLPVVQSGSDYGFSRRTRQDLRQLGLASHNFHAARGALPSPAAAGEIAGEGNPVPSWQTVLLPYLDAAPQWRAYDLTHAWDHPANAAVAATELPAFLGSHPYYEGRAAEGGFGLSHYAGNVRLLGEDGAGRLDDVRDGTSQTLLAGQVAGFYRPWADPANLRDAAAGFGFGPRQFGGPDYSTREQTGPTAGAYFLLADGSAFYLSAGMDPAAFAAYGTPAGGERLEEWDQAGESRAAWERRMRRLEASSALHADPNLPPDPAR